MSATRYNRIMKRQSLKRDSDESDLEDSQVVEERLKNLLSTNRRRLNKPKNIFDDVVGDVPKLRQSIIARALKKVVCSTPMPTQKQKDFFLSETSFNISPIDPLNEEPEDKGILIEEVSSHKTTEKNAYHLFDKEAKVVLQRAPVPVVLISDSSSDETDLQNDKLNKAARGKGKIKKIHSKTRSQSKKLTPEQTINKEDRNNQQNSNITAVNSKSNLKQRSSRKNGLTNRKRMDEQANIAPSNNESEAESDLIESQQETPYKLTSTNKDKSNRSADSTKGELGKTTKSVSVQANEKQIDAEQSNHKVSPHRSKVTATRCLTRSLSQNEMKKNSHQKSISEQIQNESESYETRNGGIVKALRRSRRGDSKLDSDLNYREQNLMKILTEEISDKKRQRVLSTKSPNCISEDDHEVIDSSKTKFSNTHLEPNRLRNSSVRKSNHNLLKNNSHTSVNINNSKNNMEANELFVESNNKNSVTSAVKNNGSIQQLGVTTPNNLSFKEALNVSDIDTNRLPELRDIKKTVLTGAISKIPVLRSRSKSKEKDNCILRTRSKSKEIFSESLSDKKEITSESPPKPPPRKKRGRPNNILKASKAEQGLAKTESHKITNMENYDSASEKTLTPEKLSISNRLTEKNIEYLSSKRSKNVSHMNNTLTKESVILNTEAACAKQNVNEERTLLEVGTSPCRFTSNNMSYKSNNAHKSPQRTSVGTSPIIFETETGGTIYSPLKHSASPVNQGKEKKSNIPTESPATVVNKHVEKTRRTEIVDKGTSPIFQNYTDTLGFGKDALSDNEKKETFNRLLLKMSCKFLDSPNTPIIEDNGTCLTKSRRAQTFNQNITQPTECNAEAAPVRRINREVQTSVKKANLKISPINKNTTSSIFTRAVIEQQTQTTSSVDNILKTYRRKRNPRRQAVRHDMSGGSRNSSTTDQSDILREFDKDHMERKKCPNVLFKSLADVMLPSFSSSDEDMMHINSENLPWRLDGDLVSVPRRSSYKLSFLRSAREIELERSRNTVLNKDSSDSETDMKIRNTDKRRKSSPKKSVLVGYTKKNKLQVYSRVSQENCENKATNESPTDEEQSCSNSIVSAVRFSEPETEDDVVCQKVINVISDVRLPPLPSTNVVKNPAENINSSLPLTTQNLKEHDRSVNKMDKSNDRLCYQDLGNIQPVAAVAKSVTSDSIHGDDSEILALPLDNSDEERLIEDNAKKKSGLQEFVEHSLVNNVQPEEKIDAKASPKKTRLEASTTKQNIRSASSDNQPEEVNFKVPKKRGRKPKKQIDMENDDGVSSTTVESHEVTGVRRSTRERRPRKIRVCGVVATHSKYDFKYYNGSSETTPPKVESSSKPRTKKNSNKTVRDKSPVKKGRGRKKVQENQEQKTETETAREKEVNPVANTIDREENTPPSTDAPKTTRKRHNNDRIKTSSDEISEEVPVKNKKTSRSNTPALRKSSPQKNHNTNEVSSSTEHQINFSANADVGNNDIPDEGIENFKRMDTNINDMNSNEVVTNAGCQNNSVDGEYPDEYEYRDSGDVFPKRQTETTSNLEGHIQTQFIKPPDKDSGRSTMLKSTTFEDSHQKPSKTLTGRIAKKYKKKENFDTKISKVLSRSINQSREVELLNGKDPKLVDMSHKEERLLRRSSILQTKPANGEFINLLTHDDVVSIKYVEKTHAYKEVGDSLMVTDVLKNGVGSMGYLKILPGGQKPLNIARNFSLFYFICEGEGLIQVHNKTAKVGKMDHFIVPLGVEYSINNLSKDDCLVLGFVRTKPPQKNI